MIRYWTSKFRTTRLTKVIFLHKTERTTSLGINAIQEGVLSVYNSVSKDMWTPGCLSVFPSVWYLSRMTGQSKGQSRPNVEIHIRRTKPSELSLTFDSESLVELNANDNDMIMIMVYYRFQQLRVSSSVKIPIKFDVWLNGRALPVKIDTNCNLVRLMWNSTSDLGLSHTSADNS